MIQIDKKQQKSKLSSKLQPINQTKIYHSVIKPPNERGYLLIFVQSIEILNDELFKNDKKLSVQITLNNISRMKQIQKKKNNKIIKMEQNYIFMVRGSNKIRFVIRNIEDEQNNKNNNYQQCSVICQFSIQKMFNYPRIKHCMQIDLAYMEKQQNGFIAQKACIMNAQMLHLNQKIGKLEFSILSAQLNRDNWMNLYVIVHFGKLTFKTETVQSSGRSVSWNKKCVIPIQQISQNEQMQLLISVLNANTFSDKLIGEININLFGQKCGILMPRYKSKIQKIQIKSAQNQILGLLKVQYKFFINQT